MTTSGGAGRPLLVIGNRNYSSWSLRAWFFLRQTGVEFETLRLPLDTPEFEQRIGDCSPTRRVPVFIHGSLRIWDSLAICEYACEMHAGFAALRSELPMNCRARKRRVAVSAQTSDDIRRIVSIWQDSLAVSGGPWLYGDFSIVDAMYAPVACRFLTYEVPVRGRAGDWQAHLFRQAAMTEWLSDANGETEVIEAEEVGGDP